SGDIKAILQELVKDRRNSRNRQTSDTQGSLQEAQGSQDQQVAENREVPLHLRQEGANGSRVPEEQADAVQPPRLTTQ
ncbi:hypothetical protein FRC08_016076, partial [Ceratobasidium sp. 394]